MNRDTQDSGWNVAALVTEGAPVPTASADAPLLKRIHWVNFLFLTLSPLIALIGTPIYLSRNSVPTGMVVMFFVLWWATSLSITAGYHRLFAHRSYQARTWVKAWFLFWGSAALQGSALKWCTDHRRHHTETDTDKDPYNIQRGFWYAHIGWIFFKELPEFAGKFAPDLAKDRLIHFQDRYLFPIAIFVCFGIPTLVGAAFGAPLGGLLILGFLRVVITHHSTFFINSFCHMIGHQTYSREISARDSALLAFFTYGEGYHNFHHKFQGDYRNGIRWYDFDPTKWLINILGWTGSAWQLRRISPTEIFKARLRADEKRLEEVGVLPPEKIAELRTQVELAQERFIQLKREFRIKGRRAMREMKGDLRKAKAEFREQFYAWKRMCAAASTYA